MQLSQNAITPAVVGKLLGMSAEIVRRRMEDGTLPIGLVERRGRITVTSYFLKCYTT